MAIQILIPTPLRVYTNNQDTVEAEGSTVGELLANMTNEYTELQKHLYKPIRLFQQPHFKKQQEFLQMLQ